MPFDAGQHAILAQGLKAARNRVGLNLEEAADRISGMGVLCTRSSLISWERAAGEGWREPYASSLPAIAAAYECDVNSLFPATRGGPC
jgi:transcriptional regulator with XRE-family HTH domain